LLLALLVSVSACAVKVGGTASPGPAWVPSFKETDQLDAREALGELTAWNPCSVVDPEGLPEGWTADLDVPAAFEDCVMSVTTDDDVMAEVQVGYLYESSHKVSEHKDGARGGGMTIVPVDNEDGSCTRDIVFADGVALGVLSWPEDEDVEAVCVISDAVADRVVDAVMAGRADALDLPKDSIGEIDPCTLVPSETAVLVPGMTADVSSDRQVSGHSCWWESETGTMLNIEFEIGWLPEGDSEKTVHGRQTAITRYADDGGTSMCRVDGEHVPYEHDAKSGLVERVGIYVYLEPGQVEAGCTAAEAVADKLWQELPPL
jgi:hypothetical protein